MVQRNNTPQNCQSTPFGPQMKTSAPNTPVKGCFHYGETGHFANNCPKKAAQNNSGQFNNNGQRQNQQQQQPRNGNQNQQANRGQQNYARGRVNHVTAESAQEAQDVVIGMNLVNSAPASVLFDSGAYILSSLWNM